MTDTRFTLRRQVEEAVARRPFLRLVQHFGRRAVGGSDTASDVDLGLAGALAVLGVPGAFFTIMLLGKYSSLLQWLRGLPQFNPYRVSVSDEYFFIVYAMAITGLVTLLRWDHLLPGRRDFANLAPLPVSMRAIFLANLAALGGAALLFAIDVNCVSAILFPLFVTLQVGTAAAFLEFAAAHAMAVMGISLFTFVALIALQGLLMSMLPEATYRRVSMTVRTVLLVFFFALLVSAMLFPLSALNFRLGSKMAGQWWPPIWFLAFFESRLSELRNTTPVSSQLALWAVAAALGLAVVSFSLSYRRYFLRIAERPEGPMKPSRVGLFGLDRVIEVLRFWVKPGPESAIYRFILKTMLRSETHLLFLGLWVGIGLLLSLEGLSSNSRIGPEHRMPMGAVLAAPLILAYSVLAGLRFVFDIPAALEANWLFRLTATEGAAAAKVVCRKVMVSCIVPWLVIVWFPFVAWRAGWADAVLSLATDVVYILFGIELILLGFRKIPFTCSFTADRDRMLRLLMTSLLMVLFVVPLLVGVEGAILRHPWKLLMYDGLPAGAIVYLRRRTGGVTNTTLFEDKGIEAFALLRLAGD